MENPDLKMDAPPVKMLYFMENPQLKWRIWGLSPAKMHDLGKIPT